MTNKMTVCRLMVFTILILTMGAAVAGDPIKGRQLYEVRCQGCHGEKGLPQVASLPNFSTGQGLMKSDMELLAVIKKGALVMPSFNGILTDAEILDIITHIRTFF